MSQEFRLPKGGHINRQHPLEFSFNGRSLQGYEGDSLAAALLANGIHHVARSFKYHRPRGIYSAGEEEPNALVEIGQGARRLPNCRATLVRLQDGLVARSQLGWPSLGFDLGRSIDFSHRLWPAGFYNKTFKWPSWHFWEPLIRNMAGLGRAPDQADPDRYETANANCDLLVCGAGPAGLIAALVTGRAGLQVILADQDEYLGGSLGWDSCLLDESPAQHWVASMQAQLEELPNVLILPRTTVVASYDHQVATLLERSHGKDWRECLWTVRSRATLLATGAIEQSLVFPQNDRPGIMLADSVRHYANRYAVAAGRRVVVACNNDSAYQAAFDLRSHGIAVAAILDQRQEISSAMLKRARDLGVAVHAGAEVVSTSGSKRLNSICYQQDDHSHKMECDVLATSGGWAPRLHLWCHARGSLKFDRQRQAFIPDKAPRGFWVVGAAAGPASLEEVFARAETTSMQLSAALGAKALHVHQPRVSPANLAGTRVGSQSLQQNRKRQWIDLAHDVTLEDAELAVDEGFSSVEHFKRFTTTGMSLDQGKTGNINAFLALSAITGQDIANIGTTTFRPPYMPVTLGALAAGHTGDGYAARRVLAAENTHRQLQAKFEDYGGWQRPDYYPLEGESAAAAIRREVLAVRNSVGVYDNSPIGKIEIRGPDAAEFLQRMYINQVHGLVVGQCRYGLMLNEGGSIIDDGIVIRLAENHFLINTTSGGASRILAWLEEWSQTEWPQLRVLVDDASPQWANFTLAGPHAREVLQKLDSNMDFSAAALPHMRSAQGQVEGLPVRVNRISFSGELSFELNIPSSYANAFLQLLLQHGNELGITPYGIEALMTLRLEKGYMHVGSDTDGETIPDDVGWGQVARNKTTDFIGKRSLSQPAAMAQDRRQLVGLLALDSGQAMRAGAHFLPTGHALPPAPTQGWITSAAYSPNLARHIALGMLRGGRALLGETMQVYDAGRTYPVKIVPTCFLDTEHRRLHA
ncbi:MAG TPA: sarcosine oxidase subunit alpha family protein [Xanthomonadales bacterium]|nr:sarcosine oxidase subunit alpha family protein [Xanthomonadales bacterium]